MKWSVDQLICRGFLFGDKSLSVFLCVSFILQKRQKTIGSLKIWTLIHFIYYVMYLIVSIATWEGTTIARMLVSNVLLFSNFWELSWQRRFKDFFLRFLSGLRRSLWCWIPDSYEWKPLDALCRLSWRDLSIHNSRCKYLHVYCLSPWRKKRKSIDFKCTRLTAAWWWRDRVIGVYRIQRNHVATFITTGFPRHQSRCYFLWRDCWRHCSGGTYYLRLIYDWSVAFPY